MPRLLKTRTQHGRRTALRERVGLSLFVASMVVLAGCAGSSKKIAATPTLIRPAAHFEDAPCTPALPAGQRSEDVRCGVLTVPENRTKSDGPTLRLAVAVLKSTSATSAPDPVVYLSGGPGQPNLTGNMQNFGREFAAPLQAKRDLVFFDQRGTGLSLPSLACSELNSASRNALAANISNKEQSQGFATVLRQCYDRLAKAGVDFTAYSSRESAADIGDLMQALGYDRYNLYGLSYGTRLALEAMRDDPEHIRSVVLDSTVLPQSRGGAEQAATFDRVVSLLLAGCKADAGCGKAYPTLEQTFFDLIARADTSPIEVAPRDPATGLPARVVVNGDRILAGAFQAFYDTSLLPLLPFAANAIAGGNTALLTFLAQQVAFISDSTAQAMGTAVECNDVTMSLTSNDVADATKGVRKAILEAHIGITDPDDLQAAQDVCRAFGIGETDPHEREPVTSDIPTVVFGGEYDPITPPAWGHTATETLSHSSFVLFPGSAHGELFGRHDCAIAIAASFLDDPTRVPDESCIAGLGEPKFLVQ